MEYRVISGDSHIDMTWMPGDLWTQNAPRNLRDLVPRVVETEEGPKWRAENKELGMFGGLGFLFNRPERGRSAHVDAMFDAGFYEGGPHPTTPSLRLQDMAIDGVDAEVLYGVLGVGLLFDSKELTQYVYQVYNDWVASFCDSEPGRWAALACIPNHDPQLAEQELRRCAKLGLKGADFAVSNAVKPIYHRDWDILWSAAAECQMPISFHTLGLKPREPQASELQDYEGQYEVVKNSMFQLGGVESLSSILASGACERYPTFQFVLGECGISWIPFVLVRLDLAHKDRLGDMALHLENRPSDLWRSHGFSTFQIEETVPDIIGLVGEDNVLWGSDYPHPDGIWPWSKSVLRDQLGRLDDNVFKKLTRDNAGKLYRFLT
jgi:predicted TIM-barrel fold metal-dependent hydrolase